MMIFNKLSKLVPYVPGEQPKDKKYIKLNTNESPYGPSPKAIEAMKQAVCEDLRLYPDPEATELRQAIADDFVRRGFKIESSNVFVGNGSDEVLALSFLSFFEQDKELLYPEISYSFYPVYSDLFELKTRKIPLKDMEIDVEDYFDSEAGVVIANPNAPTSKIISLDEIEQVLKHNEGRVVIIDEAYIDFGGATAVELVEKYENLLVVQTFSKSKGLAGLRVGFAIGDKQLIDRLNTVKNSFNSYPLDRIAQAGALAAIKDYEYNDEICKKIMYTRKWVTKKLEEMGFDVPSSAANFIFARPPYSAEELFNYLKEHGVLVRFFNTDMLRDYLRISIGTDEEMNVLIKEVSDYEKSRA